jgi:hypothetical protein
LDAAKSKQRGGSVSRHGGSAKIPWPLWNGRGCYRHVCDIVLRDGFDSL